MKSDREFQLPESGEVTTDVVVYSNKWRELYAPLESLFGARCYAFDPDLAFVSQDHTTFSIPVFMARKIVDLIGRNESATSEDVLKKWAKWIEQSQVSADLAGGTVQWREHCCCIRDLAAEVRALRSHAHELAESLDKAIHNLAKEALEIQKLKKRVAELEGRNAKLLERVKEYQNSFNNAVENLKERGEAILALQKRVGELETRVVDAEHGFELALGEAGEYRRQVQEVREARTVASSHAISYVSQDETILRTADWQALRQAVEGDDQPGDLSRNKRMQKRNRERVYNCTRCRRNGVRPGFPLVPNLPTTYLAAARDRDP